MTDQLAAAWSAAPSSPRRGSEGAEEPNGGEGDEGASERWLRRDPAPPPGLMAPETRTREHFGSRLHPGTTTRRGWDTRATGSRRESQSRYGSPNRFAYGGGAGARSYVDGGGESRPSSLRMESERGGQELGDGSGRVDGGSGDGNDGGRRHVNTRRSGGAGSPYGRRHDDAVEVEERLRADLSRSEADNATLRAEVGRLKARCAMHEEEALRERRRRAAVGEHLRAVTEDAARLAAGMRAMPDGGCAAGESIAALEGLAVALGGSAAVETAQLQFVHSPLSAGGDEDGARTGSLGGRSQGTPELDFYDRRRPFLGLQPAGSFPRQGQAPLPARAFLKAASELRITASEVQGALEAALARAGCGTGAAGPVRAKLRLLTRKADDLAVAAMSAVDDAA